MQKIHRILQSQVCLTAGYDIGSMPVSQILNCSSFLNRFNTYVVSRNIEDQSLARMTPIIPEHRDQEQSFIKKGTDSSGEYQV